MARLDIVIPVYNEGENITRLLDSFLAEVRNLGHFDDPVEAFAFGPRNDVGHSFSE